MTAKLARMFVIIALALTALTLTACSSNGDPFEGAGCQNGATCSFEWLKEFAK